MKSISITKSVLLLVLFTVIACNGNSKNSKESEAQQATFIKKSTSANVSPDCLITQNSVGEFKIGQQITLPYKSNTYKIERDEYEENFEGEDYILVDYRVFENGKEVLTMRPSYDSNIGGYSNKIFEFSVLSEKFKTKEGIGVNSTIEDFVKCYPNYKIWLDYMGTTYAIQRENTDYILFLIDTVDFISDHEINFDESVKLKPSDFKKGTKIQRIFVPNTEN